MTSYHIRWYVSELLVLDVSQFASRYQDLNRILMHPPSLVSTLLRTLLPAFNFSILFLDRLSISQMKVCQLFITWCSAISGSALNENTLYKPLLHYDTEIAEQSARITGQNLLERRVFLGSSPPIGFGNLRYVRRPRSNVWVIQGTCPINSL